MQKAINGSFGKIWMNNEEYGSCKQFEVKAPLNWESVPMPEKLSPSYKYMGYELEGTMTGTKLDSRIINMYADGILTGNIPEVDVIARVADPQANGQERIALYGVIFDEVTLMKFEANTIVEEEIPFKASSFKYLDRMTDFIN